jgi:hypothetical protein
VSEKKSKPLKRFTNLLLCVTQAEAPCDAGGVSDS